MMRTILASHVFKDHAFRCRGQSGMVARNLAVHDHHITGGLASQHNGVTQLPTLTFQRSVLGDQQWIIFLR